MDAGDMYTETLNIPLSAARRYMSMTNVGLRYRIQRICQKLANAAIAPLHHELDRLRRQCQVSAGSR